MIPQDPEQFAAFMRGETDDPGEVRAVRGGVQFPQTRAAEAFDQGAEMTHQDWNKIQAAADGSRVLLTLLVTGDEQYAQAQLDRMSVEDLEQLTKWSEILGTLAHYTSRRKFHEQVEGPAL